MEIKELIRIMTNPFYCIEIDEFLTSKHKTLVSEEDWIKVASSLIEEYGAEFFLKNLLENLKGNFIQGEESILGYK
jgi:hypothetical protein